MPPATLLSALCAASVLERTPGRQGTYLRVTPRFLAHAESTSAQLHLQGRGTSTAAALSTALASWDEYHHDPHAGSVLLADLLEERGQMGLLRPVFPMLETYGATAA